MTVPRNVGTIGGTFHKAPRPQVKHQKQCPRCGITYDPRRSGEVCGSCKHDDFYIEQTQVKVISANGRGGAA